MEMKIVFRLFKTAQILWECQILCLPEVPSQVASLRWKIDVSASYRFLANFKVVAIPVNHPVACELFEPIKGLSICSEA